MDFVFSSVFTVVKTNPLSFSFVSGYSALISLLKNVVLVFEGSVALEYYGVLALCLDSIVKLLFG
jgi:hypothetical protein